MLIIFPPLLLCSCLFKFADDQIISDIQLQNGTNGLLLVTSLYSVKQYMLAGVILMNSTL